METERDPVFDEVREHFVLKKLQERVWRLEAENKDLKVNNSILHTQWTSQRETQSDILRNLQENIEENYNKIQEGDATITRLENQLADQKQEYEDRLEVEKHQWENTVAGLQNRCDDLEKMLNEVREFQKNKEQMEKDMQGLRDELREQAENHAREISAFDRRKAMDIDLLKKDMQRTVSETNEMLKARIKDKLDQTTKRTIMENDQMATEIRFQNKQTEQLLNSNNRLLEENAQLKRNLSIHKDLENELARKTHLYQKLIKKMKQTQKAELAARDQSKEFRPGDSLHEELPSQTEVSREMFSIGSEEAERLKRQLEGVQSTLSMVRHEFGQYRRDHATLTQLQDQSTRLIVSVLYELKNQRQCDPFPPASYDESAEWQFTNMTPKQKEYFFRVLLEKLNSSMCGMCFPTGPSPSQPTLPAINNNNTSVVSAAASDVLGSQSHFSQFLWSVASHSHSSQTSQMHGVVDRRDVAAKSVQTETTHSDPCFKEGLWNPDSRQQFSGSTEVSPAMVTGGVRNWGPQSTTQRSKGVRRAIV